MPAIYEDEIERSPLEGWLPRLPLALVLVALLANTGMALSGQWNQHQALAQGEARLESTDTQKALAEGQMIDQKLSDLVHAVASLAPTDPEAQKIVNELHITVGGNTPTTAPTGK